MYTKHSSPSHSLMCSHTRRAPVLNPIPEQIPVDYNAPVWNPSYITHTCTHADIEQFNTYTTNMSKWIKTFFGL